MNVFNKYYYKPFNEIIWHGYVKASIMVTYYSLHFVFFFFFIVCAYTLGQHAKLKIAIQLYTSTKWFSRSLKKWFIRVKGSFNLEVHNCPITFALIILFLFLYSFFLVIFLSLNNTHNYVMWNLYFSVILLYIY